MSFSKYTFLIALPVLAASSVASAQEMCIQVIQPAVNMHGVCREFSTPCAVPANWKKVPSCDLIEEEGNDESNMDDVQARREAQRWQALRERIAAQKNQDDDDTPRYLMGRAAHTKNSTEYQRRLRTQQLQNRNTRSRQRTFTMPNYSNRNAYTIARDRSQKAGYGDEETTQETTSTVPRYMINGRLRPAIQSGTEMNRSGYLRTVTNNMGVRRFNTRDWDNRESVETFWKPLRANNTPRKLRTREDIANILDNRRQIRWGMERDFGVDEILED